ncbi:hypothetical protein [Vibrio alfacsensis]|uniref:hypothetical protein n=1 Tax=Vibrio alfacsensis TaxID=1074311 RepID=UPI0040696A5C
MRKTLLAALIGGLACGTNAANLDDLRISGFGSVGVGISNNDAGYAGYNDKVDFKQDTVFGLQFDFEVNDRANLTTQIVANGRYNFEPAFEVAYLSYDLDVATVRGGKIRTPFFMYSDFIDVGYAYPMLRPSQEIYEHLIINSFTGVDAIIPIEIGSSTLEIQPYAGISQVDERDLGSQLGTVDLHDFYGVALNLSHYDWSFRYTFSSMTADSGSTQGLELNDQDGTIASAGIMYNNGSLLFNAEGMNIEVDGDFTDVEAASAMIGYQFGSVMPYLATGWVKSTDDEERVNAGALKSIERNSYSAGFRWDFAQNIAFKADVSFADFNDTVGLLPNLGEANNKLVIKNSDTLVYSASVDFVF